VNERYKKGEWSPSLFEAVVQSCKAEKEKDDFDVFFDVVEPLVDWGNVWLLGIYNPDCGRSKGFLKRAVDAKGPVVMFCKDAFDHGHLKVNFAYVTYGIHWSDHHGAYHDIRKSVEFLLNNKFCKISDINKEANWNSCLPHWAWCLAGIQGLVPHTLVEEHVKAVVDRRNATPLQNAKKAGFPFPKINFSNKQKNWLIEEGVLSK